MSILSYEMLEIFIHTKISIILVNRSSFDNGRIRFQSHLASHSLIREYINTNDIFRKSTLTVSLPMAQILYRPVNNFE